MKSSSVLLFVGLLLLFFGGFVILWTSVCAGLVVLLIGVVVTFIAMIVREDENCGRPG